MNWIYLPLWSTRVIAGMGVALLVLATVRWWRERRGAGGAGFAGARDWNAALRDVESSVALAT